VVKLKLAQLGNFSVCGVVGNLDAKRALDDFFAFGLDGRRQKTQTVLGKRAK
jgi:hypothetical protein